MPVLLTLGAPPRSPPPRLPRPPPAAFSSSWNCRMKKRHLRPGTFAIPADTPRGCGDPLPHPEERDPLLLGALRAARLRDEESRRPGAGAKISRNCVVLHTPLESPDLQEALCKNGFNGTRPSLWILQGLPLFTSTSLENLLLVVSNLATKGSIFMGEVPHFPDCTAASDLLSKQGWLDNLFFTRGFRVSFDHYENVANDIGSDLAVPWKQHGGVLFVAEQLRFSDAQMESFRMHFERAEEDADEEGFEEL